MVFGNGRYAQLRIKTQSSSATPWLIEVSVSPGSTGVAYDSQTTAIVGSFTLGLPGSPLATGPARGWLNDSGVGGVTLIDTRHSTSLDMTFNIAGDGSVSGRASGQWPATPVATRAVAATPDQPTNHFFWYLSRVAAIVAYLLLFANICLGLGLGSRFMDKAIGRWRILDLHQFTALLAMGLTGLHMFALLGDSYLHFTVAQLLLPVASPYRAFWTALGVVALYLAAAIAFSSVVRAHIGRRTWRVIHYLAFVFFALVLLHSMKDGTDTSLLWVKWLYVSTGTIATALFLWRFIAKPTEAEDAATTAS